MTSLDQYLPPKAKRTAAVIAEAVEKARTAHTEAVAAVTKLKDARPTALVEMNDEDLEKLDASIRTAERAVDRAEAIVGKLEEERVKAEEAERADDIKKRTAAARKKSAEIAKQIPELFARIKELAEPLQGDLAALRREIERLREADILIDDPDVVARGRPRLERKIIGESMVRLWCYPETGQRIDDQDAVVVQGEERGYLVSQNSRNHLVIARYFRRVEFLAEERAEPPHPRIADVLDDLMKMVRTAAPRADDRQPQIEFIPVEVAGDVQSDVAALKKGRRSSSRRPSRGDPGEE